MKRNKLIEVRWEQRFNNEKYNVSYYITYHRPFEHEQSGIPGCDAVDEALLSALLKEIEKRIPKESIAYTVHDDPDVSIDGKKVNEHFSVLISENAVPYEKLRLKTNDKILLLDARVVCRGLKSEAEIRGGIRPVIPTEIEIHFSSRFIEPLAFLSRSEIQEIKSRGLNGNCPGEEE